MRIKEESISAWRQQIQAQVEAMEREWRRLDEREWQGQNGDTDLQTRLGKEETELEVARLRAELAVASFLATFHAGTENIDTGCLVAGTALESPHKPGAERLGLALFLHGEAERAGLPDAEMRWGPVTSIPDESGAQWWVSIEVAYVWHGERLVRYHYDFRVAEERVRGWSAHAEAGDLATPEPSPGA